MIHDIFTQELKFYKIFQQRQKDLLWLINTPAGKKIIGINKTEKIVRVFPNGYIFYQGKQKGNYTYTQHFFLWNNIAHKLLSIVETLDLVRENRGLKDPYEAFLHYSGLKKKNNKYPLILFTTTTFAEAANVTVRTNQAVWANAYNGTGATAFGLGQHENSLNAGTYRIDHGFLHFNTANLPAGFIIVPGSNFIDVYGYLNSNADTCTVYIVSSSAANTPTAADWGNIGSTDLGHKTYASFPGSASDNNITLNSTGEAIINNSGYSKFGLRSDRDLNNSAPTGVNALILTQGNIYLSVTYTLPAILTTHSKFWGA